MRVFLLILFLNAPFYANAVQEVIDSNLANNALPSRSCADSKGNVFVTNQSSDMGPGNNLIGWLVDSSGRTTEVTDNNLSGRAQPSNIAVNSNGDFFIVNGSAITGPGLVGWFVSNGTVQEIIDDTLNATIAFPSNIVVNGNGDFFIVNQNTVSQNGLIGWLIFSNRITPTPIRDTIGNYYAKPANISVNNQGDFFVVNQTTISSTTYGIVGWLIPFGATTPEKIIDPNLSVEQSTPFSVTANSNGDFFLTNRSFLSSSTQNVVGWLIKQGTTVPIELQDTNIGVVSGATPWLLSSNNNGDFCILNFHNITGTYDLIGWVAPFNASPSNPIVATQLLDSHYQMNFGSYSSRPLQVTSNKNGNFFITQSNRITGSFNLIGWLITPLTFQTTEISDSSLAGIGANSATPYQVMANSNGDFLINNFSQISGAYNLVGWQVLANTVSPIEIIDTHISSFGSSLSLPGNIATNRQGDFFITNSASPQIGGAFNLVGWQIKANTSVPLELIDSHLSNNAFPQNITINSQGNCIISNRAFSGISGNDNLVAWLTQ